MRIALIADVHANLHALKAVLRDIEQARMDQLVCLGDVVGYGAHPAECVELLRKLGCSSVMGNHDFYVTSLDPEIALILQEPESATSSVWAGVRHAREQLSEDQLSWLRALPPVGDLEGDVVAHAALHDFEDWPYLRTLMDACQTLVFLDGRIGFFGHTHRENVFCIEQDGCPAPEQLDERCYRLPPDTSIAVTAGATGQPRDGDHRARWLSWDTESRVLEFHRVSYDHDAAADAILAAGLPKRSAERLLPWFHPPL